MCFPKPKSTAQTTPAYSPPAQQVSTNADVKVAGVAGGSSTSGQADNIQARRRRRASANLGL